MSPEQLETYRTQGFVHLPAVFGPETCRFMQQAMDGWKLSSADWVGPWAETPGKLFVGPRILKDPVWAAAIRASCLSGVVESILGCRGICDRALAIVKPAKTGQMFPWHQDSAYYLKDEPAVVATVYMDDVTPDNGSIAFVPGSHLHGHLKHVRSGNKAVLESPITLTPIVVPAQIGDVTLFSHHCVHGSQPNTSDRPRRSARLTYRIAA